MDKCGFKVVRFGPQILTPLGSFCVLTTDSHSVPDLVMAPPFRLIKQLINETGEKYSVCKAALTANGNNLEAAAASIAEANQAEVAEAEAEAAAQLDRGVQTDRV